MDYIHAQTFIAAGKTKELVYSRLVNEPFKDNLLTTSLGLGIIVLLKVNDATQTLDRIAISDTELAKGAMRMSAKPFSQIKIPLTSTENMLIDTLLAGESRMTDDWKHMFVPELTAEEARLNQSAAGIDCSVSQPITTDNGSYVMIFSFYEPMYQINNDHQDFMAQYIKLAAKVL